jgi:hypothetical protein
VGDVHCLPGPAPTDRDPRLLPHAGDVLRRDGLTRTVHDLQEGPRYGRAGRASWATIVSAHPSEILDHVTHVRYHGGDPARPVRVPVGQWLAWARDADVLHAYDPCEVCAEHRALGLLAWDRRAGMQTWTWGTFAYTADGYGSTTEAVITPRVSGGVGEPVPLRTVWSRWRTSPEHVHLFMLGLRCGLRADGDTARAWLDGMQESDGVTHLRPR